MAELGKKICSYPCCNKAIPRKEKYCPEHKAIMEKRWADARKKLNKVYDTYSRDKKSAKIYNSVRWKKIRKWYMRRHPLCEICLKEGRIESSVLVDHIVPIKDGGAPYSMDNLQALCAKCHYLKTKEEEERRRAL